MPKKPNPKRNREGIPDWMRDQRRDWVRWELRLPRDLLHRLKLVRAVTGIPATEWSRWQLQMAADLELARRPGALWLRPGTRIYRVHLDESGAPLPVQFASALGGERVWCIEVIPEMFKHLGISATEARMDPDLLQAGMICDLTADEANQIQSRNVCVPCRDVLPREPYPWRSGIGSLYQVVRRNNAREDALRKGREAARTWAMKNGELVPSDPDPKGEK